MTYWDRDIVATLLRAFQVSQAHRIAKRYPPEPAPHDCYIRQSRIYQGQSDVAVAKHGVQNRPAR